MSNAELLDFHSNDLLNAFSQTTGTGLPVFLARGVSHDQIQGFLVSSKRTMAKPHMCNNVCLEPTDNMMFVQHDLKKHFVMPRKSNRLNHFALKSKRCVLVSQSAYRRLNSMQPVRLAA